MKNGWMVTIYLLVNHANESLWNVWPNRFSCVFIYIQICSLTLFLTTSAAKSDHEFKNCRLNFSRNSHSNNQRLQVQIQILSHNQHVRICFSGAYGITCSNWRWYCMVAGGGCICSREIIERNLLKLFHLRSILFWPMVWFTPCDAIINIFKEFNLNAGNI